MLRLGVGALVYGQLDVVVDSHFDTVTTLTSWLDSTSANSLTGRSL